MKNMGFNESFLKVLCDCQKKYNSKIPEYGESWKDCSIPFLDQRLFDEIAEYDSAKTNKRSYEELVDVINVALMLATRLKNMDNTRGKK